MGQRLENFKFNTYITFIVCLPQRSSPCTQELKSPLGESGLLKNYVFVLLL